MSHVGDILTAMITHGDGQLTPAEASSLLKAEHENKGYLAYHLDATVQTEEVSSGVHAVEACNRDAHRQGDVSVQMSSTAQHSECEDDGCLSAFLGKQDEGQDAQYSKPRGFKVRRLNLDPEDQTEMVRAY